MIASIKAYLLRPERFFLVVSLTAGLMFVFLVPPMQAPDELSHFFRAYQVSTGQVIATNYKYGNQTTTGGPLPESVKQMAYKLEIAGSNTKHGPKIRPRQIAHYFKVPLRPEVMGSAQFAGSALYTPVPYIPQAFGVGIGRVLRAPPLALFYLGRLCNLLAFIAIVYLAIRIIPVGKWGLVAIALLPMTLGQAGSMSADASTNALAFLAIAYTLFLYTASRAIKTRQMLILAALFVLLTLDKPAFAVLALLAFVLPIKKFASRRQFWWFAGGTLLACLLAAAVWSHFIQGFLANMVTSFRPGVAVSPGGQLKDMILQPWHFIHAMFETYFGYWGSELITSFVGTQYNLPLAFVAISYATLAGTWLSRTEPDLMPKRQRLYLAGIVAAAVLSVSAALYLTYNVVDASVVNGLNGRYFLPIAPLIMLLVITGKWRLRIPKHAAAFYVAGILLPLAGITLKISNYFYGWHI